MRWTSSRRQRGSTLVSVAVLLSGIALGLVIALDIREASRAKETLQKQIDSQGQALEEVTKVRNQLEALAGQTAVLAENGNENARRLVEQLKAQGVEFHPPK